MRHLLPIVASLSIACSGCALRNSAQVAANRTSGYTPSFKPIREGFRPTIPYFLAEVTFWSCESLSSSQLGDIRDHCTRPLGDGRYYQFIAAIVVNGSYESIQTTFTIWLLDGRRLDSGYIFLNPDTTARRDFNDTNLGQPMYARALELLRHAIPESKLEEAKKARPPGVS